MILSNILPAASLILAVALALSYIAPTYTGSIAETSSLIERDIAALKAAQQFKTQKDELTVARNKISPDNLSQLELLLPSAVSSIEVVYNLTALATRTGIRLTGITVTNPEEGASDAKPSSAVGTLSLSLSGAGTYQAFRAFFDAIDHSARLLDTSDLTIQSSDTGVYTFTTNLELYWLH
jgi:Tfp pilus assembly protein PilO